MDLKDIPTAMLRIELNTRESKDREHKFNEKCKIFNGIRDYLHKAGYNTYSLYGCTYDNAILEVNLNGITITRLKFI